MENLEKKSVIPLFCLNDLTTACSVMDILVDLKYPCVEFLSRGKDSHTVFKELSKRYKDFIELGVGTLYRREDAYFYTDNAAAFLVSPCYVDEVHEVAEEAAVPYMAGCSTVKEVFDVQETGVRFIKIFPANLLGGARFIKTLLSVFPNGKFIPSGGIGIESEEIASYFSAGCQAVGIGSSLISEERIEKQGMKKIEDDLKRISSLFV